MTPANTALSERRDRCLDGFPMFTVDTFQIRSVGIWAEVWRPEIAAAINNLLRGLNGPLTNEELMQLKNSGRK